MLIDYDFSRTPGSRQPSPNEEHLNRLHGLDPSINVNMSGFSQPMMQQMMNNHDQHQMNSSFHPQHQQHHPMGHPVLNGMQVQVEIYMKIYFYVEHNIKRNRNSYHKSLDSFNLM